MADEKEVPKKEVPANVLAYLTAHRNAGTPDEQTISGVAGVKITLGNIKQLAGMK